MPFWISVVEVGLPAGRRHRKQTKAAEPGSDWMRTYEITVPDVMSGALGQVQRALRSSDRQKVVIKTMKSEAVTVLDAIIKA